MQPQKPQSKIKWTSSSAHLFLQSHTRRKRALLTQVGPSLSSTLRNPDQHLEGPLGMSRCDFVVWSIDHFPLNWRCIFCFIIASVHFFPAAACGACSQRHQSEPGVPEATLVTLTVLLCDNQAFKRTRPSKGNVKIMSFPGPRPFWKVWMLFATQHVLR